MTDLANVWVRAVRLELIRADRIVSVSIGDPAGDGPGPATVFPESRSGPGDGMMLWLMASVADGAWPRAVPLRRYEVADVVPALTGLVGALAAAAIRDDPALFVYPDMGVGTSWEIRKSLPGEWVILAMPGPRSPGPGAGSSRSRRRPDPVRTLTPNQLVAFNMARLRKAAGMSQEEFGAKMGGWSVASVSAAERSVTGTRVKKFDLDEAVRIAGIFGVAVEELLKPVPLCEQCSNQPPEGYTCNVCGRSAS